MFIRKREWIKMCERIESLQEKLETVDKHSYELEDILRHADNEPSARFNTYNGWLGGAHRTLILYINKRRYVFDLGHYCGIDLYNEKTTKVTYNELSNIATVTVNDVSGNAHTYIVDLTRETYVHDVVKNKLKMGLDEVKKED